MSQRRAICFHRALIGLHALLARRLLVAISLPGAVFDCGFYAELRAVRAIEAGEGPVLLVFGYEEGIVLDPAEVVCFLVFASRPSGEPWLELRVASRAVLLLGPAPD